jgi:putative inorganic carbon (hco3(-)) transporter
MAGKTKGDIAPDGPVPWQPAVAAQARYKGVTAVLEAGAIATAFLMPLAFWAPAAFPFSSAKQWLLLTWVATGFVAVGASGIYRKRRLPVRVASALAAWLIALSLSAALGIEVSFRALIDALLPCGNFLLLIWIAPKPHRVILALVSSGTMVASVAVLQYLHLDPFRLFGLASSIQGSSRIQIFSTLGNPNFVASFLVSVLPLTLVCAGTVGLISRMSARFSLFAALIQACAIVATGSRAPILAFPVAGAWLLVRRNRSWMRYLAAGLAVTALLLLLSPARPLNKTIAGRLYIWKVIGKHIMAVPFSGYGPGSFALRFAEWETADLRLSPENANRSFSGLQDHAHNDYLEFIVDHGIFGLAAFLLMLFLSVPAFRRASAAGSSFDDGIIAGMIALLAVALVDFPLHRPTELYLLWTLMALPWISNGADRLDTQTRLVQSLGKP